MGISSWSIPTETSFAVVEEGSPDRFSASVRTILWWATLINLALILVLWASAKRWIGQVPGSPLPRAFVPLPTSRLVARLSSLAAIVLLAIIASPRLSESLWNDEIWSMGESVHGSWHRDLDSNSPDEVLTEIYWEPIGWEHAIWRYETTNHHFFLNVLAKGSLSIWQASTGAEEWEFNETALRIVPFLCALAALVVWSKLFLELGFARAAAILPLMLALHPWYQQHATEMRGYPLVFLFLPLALLAAHSCLKHGRWCHWLGYSAYQFLLLYSWPAAAIVILPFNICLAIAVARGRSGLVKRWAVANLFTAMALLPLIAPGVFQIGSYLENEIVRIEMGVGWLRDLASFFFVGSGWQDAPDYSARGAVYVCGEFLFNRHPLLFLALTLAATTGLVLGIRRLLLAHPKFGWLLLAGLMAGPTLSYIRATAFTDGTDVYLFAWYFIFLLPLACGVIAIGWADAADEIAARLPRRRRQVKTIATSAGLLTLLAMYAWCVSPRSLALRESSMDPRRESARSARGDLALTDPANAKILTVHVLRSALVYDPFGWVVDTASNDDQPPGSPPGLTQLMRIADTRDLTLFVNVGLPGEAREKYPELMALVEEPEVFELHSRHFGLEPRFERAVYRYRGGLFKFDFSAPKR